MAHCNCVRTLVLFYRAKPCPRGHRTVEDFLRSNIVFVVETIFCIGALTVSPNDVQVICHFREISIIASSEG